MRTVWSRLWLMLLFVGLVGIILYLVSEFSFYRIVGANTRQPIFYPQAWYRAWVAIPVVILVIGLAGLWFRGTFSRPGHSLRSWVQSRKVDGSALERTVTQIGMRQLAIVAVVAVVFGAGAGYLGGNFDRDWVGLGAKEVRIGGLPASEYQRRQAEYWEERNRQREIDSLRRAIECVEERAVARSKGIYVLPCY